MNGNPASFGQFPHFLEWFKCVLLNFEQFDRASSTHTDQMTIMRANSQLVSLLHAETAFGQSFILESVDKEELVVRFSQHEALDKQLNTMNFGYEGENTISLMLPCFSVSWKI